jgi:hypothetical protein
MENVLPFITRLAARGDWSSGERARLIRMAEHLAGDADDLDIAFGRTDEGDPWCVVVDATGDVLVHVARVGGRFIVHQALGDVWEEGADLLAVLRSYLGAAWVEDPAEQVVVKLDPEARKSGQGFTALIIATAFYYATAAASDPEVRHAPVHSDDDPGVRETAHQLIEALATPEARPEAHAALAARAAAADGEALQAAAPVHAPEAAHPALELAAAAAAVEIAAATLPAPEAPQPMQVAKLDFSLLVPARYERIVGTEGADELVGGPGATVIVAGGGDDKLDGGGAPAGAVDLLDGGPGDDTIVLGANTIAKGGSGADTFVVSKPADAPPSANNSLGIVLDLNRAEGDAIKSAQGGDVTVVATAPTADALAEVRSLLPGLNGVAAAGEELTIDIDGDGQADGVLLVVHVAGQIVFSLAPIDDTPPAAPGLVGAPAERADVF